MGLYEKLLHERINELNNKYENIFRISHDLKSLKEYWGDIERISDIDNAHAMYLSSNNWDFSVFNDVIEKLDVLLNNDYAKLSSILCAGVEDVRSALYSIFDDTWKGVTKDAFFRRIITDNDYVRQRGVCPCFAYVTLQAPKVTNVFNREAYMENLSNIKKGLNQLEKDSFSSLFSLYCKLYYMRLAYDTYEYFGYYSLIRHYAIFVTYICLLKEDEKTAQDFRRCASTYQFSRINDILGGK